MPDDTQTAHTPKHSPGPWVYCGEERGGCQCMQVSSAPGDHPICVVTCGEWGDGEKGSADWMHYGTISEDTAKANAALIAKAPQLAESHKRLVGILQAINEKTPEDLTITDGHINPGKFLVTFSKEVIQELRAALAQAANL